MFLVITTTSNAQIINQFTWDTNPVTKAFIGPDALSSSSRAYSGTGGMNGTNGLNPGTPNTDINLTLDGANYNVPGIEVSFNFRREENDASFFRRASSFDFGMTGGNLYATFKISNGGSIITVSSGNVYAIPNDHAFHFYKFKYDYVTGVGTISVDGTTVYTYNGVPGRQQNWSAGGNAVIGATMDASGRNITVLDNFTIQNTTKPVTLPLNLLSFDAIIKNNIVQLGWATNREFNVNSFEIERSSDGSSFKTIHSQLPKGGFTITNNYTVSDMSPVMGASFYRLKMIDNDGRYTYSEVRKVQFNPISGIKCFPNPAVDFVMISLSSEKTSTYTCSIHSLDGALLKSMTIGIIAGFQNSKIDVSQINYKGIIVVQLNDETGAKAGTYKIYKK